MAYEVQTPVFEGPLDLLLHLILRQQVDIYDLSLTGVVDAYVQELGRLPAVDLEVATEFLLLAATLVELKSRWLLPSGDDVEIDEELRLWEERDLLLARLLECKTFKDAAAALDRLAAAAGRSHPRRAGLEERFLRVAPDLLAGITADALRDACLRALAPRVLPGVDLDHVAPIRASVREAVDELLGQLPDAGRTSFRDLTRGLADRLEIVVRFLALLELYKQGLVDLTQTTTFGEIAVSWLGSTATDVGVVLAEAEGYD